MCASESVTPLPKTPFFWRKIKAGTYRMSDLMAYRTSNPRLRPRQGGACEGGGGGDTHSLLLAFKLSLLTIDHVCIPFEAEHRSCS